MLLVCFDTETDGLPRNDLPPDHEDQVHLVQLGAILARLTTDSYEIVSSFDLIMHPQKDIPAGAARVHGITTEMARKSGVQLQAALRVLFGFLEKSRCMVAYNIGFDLQVLRCAFAQAAPSITIPWPAVSFDPMPVMTDVCKLPPTSRQKRYRPEIKHKTPKLEEAYQHAFGEPMVGAHSAIADCHATLRLYNWCRDQALDVSMPGLHVSEKAPTQEKINRTAEAAAGQAVLGETLDREDLERRAD